MSLKRLQNFLEEAELYVLEDKKLLRWTCLQDVLETKKYLLGPGAVAQRCSVKKMFLELSQNSQENTCASVFFLIKLQASGLQLY